jgi:hypothetical protein
MACTAYITTIHCVAQKLQLNILQSLKEVPYTEKTYQCLIAIFKLLNNSSKTRNSWLKL